MGADIELLPETGLVPRETLTLNPLETLELLQARPTPAELTYDQVLAPYVIVFCLGFVVAYLATPVMRWLAVTRNIVDRPDGDGGRKLHRRPVAYLGGIAVFVGLVTALGLGQLFSDIHVPGVEGKLSVPGPIVVGITVITLLGLIDDIRGISPIVKILGQVAAAICLLSFGVGDTVLLEVVSFVYRWLEVNLGVPVTPAMVALTSTFFSWGFVIALVVFCCNASNLMDGLDGLCGGVTAIIALGLVFVAASVAQGGSIGRAEEDALRVALSLAIFGSVLGFLPFNFNPASIFMGDAGSLLMGFCVAVMIILLGDVGSKWLLGGMVMFSLPVLDTALAFARRWLAGRPLFSADKHHFHHQLMHRGKLTVRQAVLVSYGLTIFFVISGAMMVYLRTRYAVAFYLVLFGCIIVAAYKIGMIHERAAEADEPVEDEADDAVEASAPRGAPAQAGPRNAASLA
jgi:UDP-GlcNAc:undecaprenyl-phosphate GlcNAc-1-phosphate transferase